MKPSHAFFGLALIVLGVLFLLDRLTAIRFGNWWPLLLIVFGLWLVITKGRPDYLQKGGQAQTTYPGSEAAASPATEPPPVSQPAATDQPSGPAPASGYQAGGFGPGSGPQGAAEGAAPPFYQAAPMSRALDFERSVAFSEMHERYAATLRRGKATVVFGSGVIDLTQAVIPPEGASVEAVAVFGSVRVYAPPGCRVSLKGTPVLGSFKLKPGAMNAMGTGPELRVEGAAVLGGVEVYQ